MKNNINYIDDSMFCALTEVSHEMRSALNGILLGLDLLKCSDLDNEQNRITENINKLSKYLHELVTNILNLSQIEAGKRIINYKEFDIKELINEIISSHKILSDQKRLNLTYSISPNDPKSIISDSLAIKEIIINLLTNAIKYTNKGEISLKINCNEDKLVLKVKDTGIGIKKEDICKIFNKFTRKNSGGVGKLDGIGVGLSIVKKLVALLGGRIYVNSDICKGSTFIVKLPMLHNAEEALNGRKDRL